MSGSSFLSDPLKPRPRALPRRTQGSASSLTDFEPRLHFFIEETRRVWPGGAPRSWTDAVRCRQWPEAFPGIHWASVECLLEFARQSGLAGEVEMTCAWQVIALAATHLIVDGGGLPLGMVQANGMRLEELLVRADACMDGASMHFEGAAWDEAALAHSLGELKHRLSLCEDVVRKGFANVLSEIYQFRGRLRAPDERLLVASLWFVICQRPDQLSAALQLGTQPPGGSMQVLPAGRPLAGDALLQGLLQVQEKTLGKEVVASIPAKHQEKVVTRKPRSMARPAADRVPRQEGIPPAKPLHLLSSSSRRSRRTSDARVERSWDANAAQGPTKAPPPLPLPPFFRRLPSVGLVGLALLGLTAIAVALGQLARGDRGGASQAIDNESNFPNPIEAAEAFVQTTSIDERVAMLADPSDAAEARAYFLIMDETEARVDAVQPLGYSRCGTLGYHASRVRYASGQSRLVCLVTDPTTGAWKVSWPAFARRSTETWSALLNGQVIEGEYPVFVEQGDYYNFQFSDDEKYRCYRITSPDVEAPMYAYVEYRSNRYWMLESILADQRIQRMIVRLKKPKDAEDRQFWMEEIISDEWLRPPSGSLEHSAFAADFR